MISRYITIVVAALLSGCVSDYSVKPESATAIHDSGFASLRSTRNVSGSDWTSFTVERIDGPKTESLRPIVTQDYILALVPGLNSVSFRVNEYISKFAGNDQRNGTGIISFLAQPGTPYILTGYISGDVVNVWISESKTLRKVTEEIEILLSETDSQKFDFIPIIIPIQK